MENVPCWEQKWAEVIFQQWKRRGLWACVFVFVFNNLTIYRFLFSVVLCSFTIFLS